MLNVSVSVGQNPDEVILQGNALGVAAATWYTMITIPNSVIGQLRTIVVTFGQPRTGVWEVSNLRIMRGATQIWAHAYNVEDDSLPTARPAHYDVGVMVQPGDVIQYYLLTGTPSFSVTGYCTATVLQRGAEPKGIPICGDAATGDPGLPLILQASSRSARIRWRQLMKMLIGRRA